MDGPGKSLELDLPPSCVEFCPAFPSYFLVGTYSLQLEDANAGGGDGEDGQATHARQPQNRNGSIVVFRLLDGAVTHVQTEPQPSAILDLRFNPHDGCRDICAVVSSTATVGLFRLTPGQDPPLKHLNTMGIAAMSQGEIGLSPRSEILFTSFGWHPLKPDTMAVTTSTGQVYMVHLPTFDGSWKLDPEPVITHTLETWCVTISPALALSQQSDGSQETKEVVTCRVYSGGDDSMLRYRTCSWKEASVSTPLPALQSRGHEAGVTAILPLFQQEDGCELVVTGSYDEHIRLFSVPPVGRAVNLVERSLGGGVWRLNLIDLEKSPRQDYSWRARILASCMHAGSRVVELVGTKDGGYEFRVLGRFEEHQSMNYGSDFQPGWKDQLSVVSTSFYDKLLCFWKLDME
ncbi:hypothetical protein BT67DRAFT_440363 [Trichocladium antarcticum]|uniref:Diphthine methyltransferase n=1 Tax=Trichocladium antarcticum TaxID=1450529 RepID=A0AAN6UP91_9PEZI|nr:hypothetical protein BT67DRAFT_440363 [Trichocladium antarcticum]